MTVGPGKYDDVCTQVREQTDAHFVIVIVGGGSRGSGFSVQTDNPTMLESLPSLLESIARQIRDDVHRDMQ
jgi:hypothetical protein